MKDYLICNNYDENAQNRDSVLLTSADDEGEVKN